MSQKLTFENIHERFKKYNQYNHQMLLTKENFNKMYKSRQAKTLEFICRDCK